MKQVLKAKVKDIYNLENNCKTMEGNLKIEKKRIKKERQKAEKQESRVEVEIVENEEDMDVPNVPTSNKFETLQNVSSDPREDVERCEKKECDSQTDFYECDICSAYFIMETSLKDHIIRKHTPTSESGSQTSMFSKITSLDEMTVYEKYPCFYCEKEIVSEVHLK